jgi:GT2 family glycosyltransferase
METLAPAVVAVIVTRDPGPWFDEALAAFGAQDYAGISFLVLDAGSAQDPTEQVARGLPGAYVRLLGRNDGFGASANEAIGMIEGASHLLLCHDDIAPDPDVVGLLMEEAYRSNAGIVAPKLVSWDDPSRLLHVGMAVDKSGAVVDRVESGELDAGQHDAVRDVFLVPGGCTLVRADLFAELGGYDPDIFVLGEDLDLCWRAQIAGARVVVAPAARVRHLEELANGRRSIPAHVLSGGPPTPEPASAAAAEPTTAPESVISAESVAEGRPGGTSTEPDADTEPPGKTAGRRTRRHHAPGVTLQAVQRRHELHAVCKAYGRAHLVRVLPQVVVLSLGEYSVARLTRHRDRAIAVTHAWRWNLARRNEIAAERRQIAAGRRLGDAEVRRLQIHGSARLTAYLRRALAEGLRVANVGGAAEAARMLDDTAGPPGPPPRRVLPGGALAWAVTALVVVFGSRSLFGTGLPYVGQFLALPSVSTLLHRFAAGWQPAGVGTTDPTSPATALLGGAGIVTFGAMGLLQKLVVLGCVPLGAFGMVRLLAPLNSTRARTVAGIVYLAMPAAYDSIATGQWSALVAYAASPWIVLHLTRAGRFEPFDDPYADGHRAGAHRPGHGRSSGRPGPATRRSLALGLLLAVVVAVAPSCSTLMPVLALGAAAGALFGGAPAASVARMLRVALGAIVTAAVLLVPWLAAVVGAHGTWQVLAGVAPLPANAPGWSQLLRLGVGPIGDTALTLGFLVAAALPLWVGRRWRLAWAIRSWTVAVFALTLAWAVGRGWLGPVAVPAGVLVAAAGCALASAIGIGVVAFENDLHGHRFGWRQAVSGLAGLAAVVASLPVLAASVDGRWHLPEIGYGQATAWMSSPAVLRHGDFRVLWIGDPRAVPGAGWQALPGLAYTLSTDGVPDASGLWPPADPGEASGIADALEEATAGSTIRLGALLAPYAIRYVVLVDAIAPSIPGLQTPVVYPPPTDVEPSLLAQVDLRQLIGQGGFDLFEDDQAVPLRGVHAEGRGRSNPAPVLVGAPDATAVRGFVPPGTLVAAVAPGESWRLVSGSQSATPVPALRFPASFPVAHAGVVTLRFRGSLLHGVAVVVEVALWIALVAVLLGRRRWLDWWWLPLRTRRAAASRAHSPVAKESTEPTVGADHPAST